MLLMFFSPSGRKMWKTVSNFKKKEKKRKKTSIFSRLLEKKKRISKISQLCLGLYFTRILTEEKKSLIDGLLKSCDNKYLLRTKSSVHY